MKKLLALLAIPAFLSATTISGEYEYLFGDDVSIIDARKNCQDLALRNALESFATFISSKTEVVNYVTQKDQIVAVAKGIVRNLKVIDKKEDKATNKIFIKLTGEVDEDEVMKMLKSADNSSPALQKINDYIKLGLEAEKDLRIGDAIKYFYHGLLLSQNGESAKNQTCAELDGKLINIAVPDRIKKLLTGLKFEIENINEESSGKTVMLNINYNGEPVQNLDFKYFLGNDWSQMSAANNGMGILELFGAAKDLSKTDLAIEYKYERDAKNDAELTSALKLADKFIFPAAKISLNLVTGSSAVAKPMANLSKQEGKVRSTTEEVKDGDLAQYQNTIEHFLTAIKTKKYDEIKALCTPGGMDAFNKLIRFGNAKVLKTAVDLKIGKINNSTVVRSIPMSFSFKNNVSFTENVVLSFNEDDKIEGFSFALGSKAEKDLLQKEYKDVTVNDKLQILNFMEMYKTAYSLKQLDMIKNIFAENALIIVGRTVKENKEQNIENMYKQLGDKVEYVRLNKNDYLKNLEKTFASNEFINIKFEKNRITKDNKRNVFGIQIDQNYYSSNYSDKGHLFLIFDIQNPNKPQIYVRTWQPMADDKVFKITDFEF